MLCCRASSSTLRSWKKAAGAWALTSAKSAPKPRARASTATYHDAAFFVRGVTSGVAAVTFGKGMGELGAQQEDLGRIRID
jgi:hypothetical protein